MRAERIRGSDAQARLGRVLVENAAASGCTVAVEHGRARPWASATFVGEQISLTLRVSPLAAARVWIDGLRGAELPMHGYVAMPPAVDGVTEGETLEVALSCLVLIDG